MDIDTALRFATSVTQLARILGVKRQAVQYYVRKKHLPPGQVDELRKRRPEWFAQLKREADLKAAEAKSRRAA